MMCRLGGPGTEGTAGGGRDAVASIGRGGRHWRPHPHLAAGAVCKCSCMAVSIALHSEVVTAQNQLELAGVWVCHLHPSCSQHHICTGGILLPACVTECILSIKCCSGKSCSYHLHTAGWLHDAAIAPVAQCSAPCNSRW